MSRSKSSKRWLHEHNTDSYVKKSRLDGYRSRAVYKLLEIDQKEKLFKPGMIVVDLGAAPGGWSQYVAKALKNQGKVFALDILDMDPIEGVQFIKGDFTENIVLEKLFAAISSKGVDMVLSDMAPNITGHPDVDIPRAMYLAELAIDFSDTMLKKGGGLFIKLFHGSGFDELVKEVRKKFMRVVIRKPDASRSRSRETYLLARGYNLK